MASELGSETEILKAFVEGMNMAMGAAGALVTAQRNPNWGEIRDRLQVVRDLGRGMGMARALTHKAALESALRRQAGIADH